MHAHPHLFLELAGGENENGDDSVREPRRKPKRSWQQRPRFSPSPLLSAPPPPLQRGAAISFQFTPPPRRSAHSAAAPLDAARPRLWGAPAVRRAPPRRRHRQRRRRREQQEGWRRGGRARAASSTRRCSGRGRAGPSASASPAPFPKVIRARLYKPPSPPLFVSGLGFLLIHPAAVYNALKLFLGSVRCASASGRLGITPRLRTTLLSFRRGNGEEDRYISQQLLWSQIVLGFKGVISGLVVMSSMEFRILTYPIHQRRFKCKL